MQAWNSPATNARAIPIYQTTSYQFDNTEHAASLEEMHKQLAQQVERFEPRPEEVYTWSR